VTWAPEPRVVIGGRDYTGQTVGRMSVRRGRKDVDAAPSAGQAQVTLRDVDGGPLQVRVGQEIALFVQDSSGADVQVFGGVVEEVGLSTVSTGAGEAVAVWQVSANGPLARLNRRTVLFDGRPQEDDGDRVSAAVSAGLARQWQELGSGLSWSDVAASTTWGNFDPGFDASLIDPGVYQLAALGSADGGYNPLTVANDAAFSARGVLYETRDGFVSYADANRRVTNGTAVAMEIPTTSLSQSGLGFRQILTSLVNKATVTFPSGAYTATDAESVSTYGLWQTEFDTQLADASAGSAVAEEWVLDRSAPAFEIDEVRLLLNNLGTAALDAMLEVEPNDPVELTGMPSNMPFDRMFGFVEEVAFSVNQFTAEVTLTVSDAALSSGATRWNAVGTAVTWASVGTALVWADARSL